MQQLCAQAPTIASFSPTAGNAGSPVTITGTNFSTTPASNIVYFGAVKAVVSAASNTALTVTVPTGASYQPITVTVNGLTAYATKPFVVTFPGLPATNSLTYFAPNVDFATGPLPYTLCVSDVDADGKPDVVTANYNNNTISVFKNNSTLTSITFAAKVDYVTGSFPRAVATGDLDGDGLPDIAVANQNSNTVSVFKNTSSGGNISFAAKADFAVTASPQSLTIGDINGDGQPELVAGNYTVATVSVLKNTSSVGNISFAAKVDFTTAAGPHAVVITDINGDGVPDIITANTLANSMSVLKGIGGTILFDGKVDFATNTRPYHLSVGDLNNDGLPDVAVACNAANILSILQNQSTAGVVDFAGHADLTTPEGPYLTTIADLDGDGKPEVAVAGSIAALYKNNSTAGGTINLALQVSYRTGAVGITTCDINGDGVTDVITTNNPANSISVLRNNIIPPPVVNSFTPASAIPATSVNIKGKNFKYVRTVLFGGTPASAYTVVNDSVINAIVSIGTTGVITVNTDFGTGSSTGTFVIISPPTIASFWPLAGPVGTTVTIKGLHFAPVADSNIVYFGGAKATIINGTDSSLIVNVPVNATYQPITVTKTGFTAYAARPFTVTFTGGTIKYNSFGPNVDFPVLYPISTTIGDFDGDGKNDIGFGDFGNPENKFFSVTRNISSGPGNINFAPAQKFRLPDAANSKAIAFADLDGDGKLDMITTTIFAVYTYLNTSTPGNISFLLQNIVGDNGSSTSITVRDIDGDGKPDIIASSGGYTYDARAAMVFRNLSTPGNIVFNLQNVLKLEGTNKNYSVAVDDVDGDNKPDIVLTQSSTNYSGPDSTVLVFRNLSSPSIFGFDAPVPLRVQLYPYEGVALTDLDGDSKPDIITANYTSNSISILRNKCTVGSILFDPHIDYTTDVNPVSVTTGDLDGDGKPDIIVNNILGTAVSVYKNNSVPGSIALSTPVLYAATGNDPYASGIGDMDGDGRPEIVIANHGSNTFSVLRNMTDTTVLPLSLLNFTATLKGSQTILQWQTASEQNTAWFYVERCALNQSFKAIGKVAAAGNSTLLKQYGFTDAALATGTNYYRLKLLDADGRFTYSKTVSVNINNSNFAITVLPNPVKNYAVVKHPQAIAATIRVLDMQGRLVKTVQPQAGAVETMVNVTQLAAGMYKLTWGNGTQVLNTTMVVE